VGNRGFYPSKYQFNPLGAGFQTLSDQIGSNLENKLFKKNDSEIRLER